MNHLNNVLLGGFVALEPKLVTTSRSGCKAVAFAICNRQFHKPKDQEEWKENVLFMDVILWGRNAETIFTDIKKGTDIIVVGKLKCDTWRNKDGSEMKKLEINAEHIQYKKEFKGKEKSMIVDALDEEDEELEEVREKAVIYNF